MSNTIIELRHSYVTGNVPSDLANGEIAINTYDGKLFYRGGASNTIQTIEKYEGPAGLVGEVQFNDFGVLGSSNQLTFDKPTGLLQSTLIRTSNLTASNVTTESFIRFGDGTIQYTANAGSGGGTDQYARDTANAAFEHANSSFISTNSVFSLANGNAIAANTPSHVANSAAIYANGAFAAANTLSNTIFVGTIFDNVLAFGGNNAVWNEQTVDLTPYANKTIRIVWHYVSGSSFTGDMQIDDVYLGGTSYTFESDAEGFETSTSNTSSYGSVSFTSVATTTTAGRWNRDSGGTTSVGTALNIDHTLGTTGGFYLYAETSTSPYYNFWLRTPEVTLNANPGFLSFWEARYGATMGNTVVYVSGESAALIDIAENAYDHANAAFIRANSAQLQANAAFIQANTPSHVANSAASYANSAFIRANSAFIAANVADSKAVSAGSYANSAFIQANSSFEVANSASSYANAAFIEANSSFEIANGAFVRANNSLNANTGGIIDGNVIITGNLIVQGTEFITQTDTLAIHDNMIYLNNPIAANVTNAVGNGTYVIYTTDITHGYDVGMGVSITGITPSSFNISGTANTLITEVTSNTFTVASSVTDTYVSGGIARARTSLNPDLGFAGGYYDTSYAHAGLFRDASDGIWKFFYNYTPEPDTSPYIDTNDPSFRIASLTANLITDVITVRGVDPLTQANLAFDAANNEAGVNATQNTDIQLAWNTANAAFEQANTGGGGETQNVTIVTFNTTANGTTLTYDLGFNPVSANAIFVTIDGIVQPESSYSINASANTITFDSEPVLGENVRVVAFAQTNPYIIEDQSIDPVKFSTTTNTYISTAASDAAIALAIALG